MVREEDDRVAYARVVIDLRGEAAGAAGPPAEGIMLTSEEE